MDKLFDKLWGLLPWIGAGPVWLKVIFATFVLSAAGLIIGLVAVNAPAGVPAAKPPQNDDVAPLAVQAEEKIIFTPDSILAPGLEATIENAVRGYQRFLFGLGYRSRTGRIEIAIRDQSKMQNMISYYNNTYDQVITDRAYASDLGYILRDYTHHTLWSAKEMIPAELTPDDWQTVAIESGLAAYFPCSFRGTDHLSTVETGFRLANMRQVNEIRPERISANNAGAEVWGGLFWSLRTLLGTAYADQLIWKSWASFVISGPDPKSRFAGVVIQQDAILSGGTHHGDIVDTLRLRGLSI